MKLTKGMFGTEFHADEAANTARKLFKLSVGQMCGGPGKIGHNCGWYSKAGDKLGWGDLHERDIPHIQSALEEGQLFITLGEQDSFWKFVTSYGPIGAMCGTNEDMNSPGKEYVAEHFVYAISKDRVFCRHTEKKDPRYLDSAGLLKLMNS